MCVGTIRDIVQLMATFILQWDRKKINIQRLRNTNTKDAMYNIHDKKVLRGRRVMEPIHIQFLISHKMASAPPQPFINQ